MLSPFINKAAKQFLLLGLLTLALAWSSHAGTDRTELPGHVPAAVKHLTPEGSLPATNRLHLAIGLPLRDSAGLDEFLAQVSDPASPKYRKFLSPEEMLVRFSPTEADYAAVKDFALVNGFEITGEHANRLLLGVTASASDVERAFGIKLKKFKHPTETREFFAPDAEPSVPAGLQVLDVQGLSDYYRPYSKLKKMDPQALMPRNGSAPGGSGAYFGDDFRNAYVPGSPLTGAGQQVGLLQFDGFYSNDIAAYATAAGGGRTNIVIQTVLLDGFNGVPTTGQNSGNGEVSLDIEMAMAMAPGLSRIVVYEAPNSTAYFNDILNSMLASNTVKNLSCSWGGGGPNSTSENIFKLMASQGQSFFNASGDSCAFTGAIPFPSESTNITQVGATTLTTGSGAAYGSERVWNWGETIGSQYDGVGSSGGISTTYSIPSWQQGISMTANHGSTAKRNIPDVALTGDNVYVISGGNAVGSGGWGGTSCAAPLWAGFMALVNQQAALGGNPPAGFINPAIYAIGKGTSYTVCFHDTASGDNYRSSSPTNFPGVAGFDLCTGWGTPNGTNLINALAPLAYSSRIVSNGWSVLGESAVPTNGAIDPGETVTVTFTLQNQGNLAAGNLVATLQPNAGVLAPGGPQSYGALAASGGTASRPFTFTSAGVCGSNIVAVLQLQDGTNNLGTVSFTLPLGQNASFIASSQNFDSVAKPALPSGWNSVTVSGTTNKWTTTTASFDTSPNSAFCAANFATASQNALVSPVIPVASSAAQLVFRHNYSFEYRSTTGARRDGGVLEIKIGNGSFADILSAGGTFGSGGYTNTINSSSNPLNGRSAWVISSQGWKTVIVNLPPSAAGQNIQLRWNCATDNNNSGTGAVGWYVDSLSITDAAPSCLTVQADLAVGQSLAPASLQVGQNLVYTLSVTNQGPQPAANVIVTDTVPASVTFLSASPGCSYVAGKVVCPVGTMAVGSVTNFNVTLAPSGSGPFTNIVSGGTVTPESGTANDTSTLVSTQAGAFPPSITSGPLSQTIECSGNATFSMVATGSPPLILQWRLDGVPVAGATNASFPLTNVHLPSHTVSVTVTNLYGSVTSNALLTVQDTLPPVITLNGSNPIYLNAGDTFADPGATASDACAGAVPVNVIGSVNTGVAGTNTLTYTAGDSSGNTNAATRTVIVRPLASSVSLAASVNPSGYRDSLAFTATVTPADATGTIEFRTNGFSFDLETIATGVAASTNQSALPRGTNGITAIYSGDARYLPSTNSIQQVVTNHPPTGASMVYTNGANFTLTIPLSDLSSNWSDPDGDTISFVAASTSTNGITVNNTGTALVYSNANPVADQFLCTIADAFGGTNSQVVAIVPALDPTPLIKGVPLVSNQTVVLILGGEPGRTYVLESRSDFEPASLWLPIATNTLGTNGLWQFTDPKGAAASQSFYRLKLLP